MRPPHLKVLEKQSAFGFDLCTFVLSSKLSYSKANKRTFPHWINDIHVQQTIWMGFSKYRRSHTVFIFIILMNKKSVSISVYIENKTTKIRLSPCVHITYCTVIFRYLSCLWMLTSYVTGGCCHIPVVSECYGSPLTTMLFSEYWCNLNEVMFGWNYIRDVHEVEVKGHLGVSWGHCWNIQNVIFFYRIQCMLMYIT